MNYRPEDGGYNVFVLGNLCEWIWLVSLLTLFLTLTGELNEAPGNLYVRGVLLKWRAVGGGPTSREVPSSTVIENTGPGMTDVGVMSIELLKRAPDELELAAKRIRQDLVDPTSDLPPRTSDLAAPIMHLTGHSAEFKVVLKSLKLFQINLSYY
eukprot:sb/3473290/